MFAFLSAYSLFGGEYAMKKLLSLILAGVMLSSPAYAIDTLHDEAISIAAPSAILMEKESGEIIYEKNADERMAPASVTKVMTMLLIVEAIDRGDISLEDTVTASKRASSFGGSCVFLEEGEQMSVHEMLKCITVVSANDCAVAMSEFLCGTEEAFVDRMNARAAELGLSNTHFTNCTGLFDDDDHYTTAHDIAVMSRELISHEMIKDYSTIWIDTIRNGEFGLSSTNKLVYYYDGCTGLKTGFTEKAMYCLSATAERDGTEYIAVIMHGETSDSRNEDAKTLLNYAFANYSGLSLRSPDVLPPISVKMGEQDSIQPLYNGPEKTLVLKQGSGDIKYVPSLPEEIPAPICKGEQVGTMNVYRGDELLCEIPLISDCDVACAGFMHIYGSLTKSFVGLL